jgi:ribokinase
MNPGGKGANQAVAAARLGGSVAFVANLGNDVFGQQALHHFQQENINTSFVTTDPLHPSGVALIVVDAKGENNITVASGSNGHLDTEKVKRALADLQAPAILLLQMEIPADTIDYAVSLGQAKNLKVILNPAPGRSLEEALLAKLYLITPNESEAELLTGIKVIGSDTAAKAARKLRDLGVRNVVITLGARGAYLLTDTIGKLIPAPTVTALDTTAAGDCFNGALAVGLAEGMSLEEAVMLASRAASISVTRLGAQASMPYRNEV